ncbi:hypothetical protein AMAG_11084 [Allomyces macrogynus ATCC 38327]|uniref:Uncharacterized protein n=1 Tax=Allomyces macrogynus (strain ATCC 38327) TaxID=578462 RepID=A0A0L0SSK1_ALLM3|nr:hypothetical protein AMAG_11084 [Allomyces macrogynus ATCC 38327]|eukprot:KNE65461.1 hypothetical protein AMAG_11084 [Allomyces macrogynus ATCC 38327]
MSRTSSSSSILSVAGPRRRTLRRWVALAMTAAMLAGVLALLVTSAAEIAARLRAVRLNHVTAAAPLAAVDETLKGESYPVGNDTKSASTADVVHYYRSRIDASFAHMEHGMGHLEAHAQPVTRKLGLVVVPAGEHAKRRVDRLVAQFGLDQFTFLLCVWDNSTWDEFAWARNVTVVRARGQTKMWFVKRFVPPEVVQNYDYVWLLDDDMAIDMNWSPVDATHVMKAYNVHFAQPSLTFGSHFLQAKIQRRVPLYKVGHWANFVEVLAPIISRGAYACAWQLIPSDTHSSWGVDNLFYPACGVIGYCRFAILDAFPMAHLDTKSFSGAMRTKLDELRATKEALDGFCTDVRAGHGPNGTVPRAFCDRLARRNVFREYETFAEMRPADTVESVKCFEEPGVMGRMTAVPWWYARVV